MGVARVGRPLVTSPEWAKFHRVYIQNHFELAQMALQASYTHATCMPKTIQFSDAGLKYFFYGDLTFHY